MMSSDYGSDIHSDDLNAIEDARSEPVVRAVPAATPRGPLRQRDANVLATPPPSSQGRQGDGYSRKATIVQSVAIAQYGSRASKTTAMSTPYPTPVAASPSSGAARCQNVPSLSQPLPTPFTAQSRPPSFNVFPSSQPSPSKTPTVPRQSQSPPQARCIPGLNDVPPSTQSTFCQSRLYRFPFGVHRGKTLLEVPDNYIAYLRIDQNMADSMPGFAAVLRLFDAGKPPITPLPPPSSSQQTTNDAPSSIAPARPIASAHSSSTGLSSTPPCASQTEYRFDFGIHTGKTLNQVASDYLDFLKQRGIVEGKPALAMAVARHERLHPPTVQTSSSQDDPAGFTLKFGKFGKHRGKTLDQVPEDYLDWLKSSNILEENRALRAAFAYYEKHSTTARGAPKKRKRTSDAITTGHARSSGRRRLAPPKRMRIWY